MAATKAKEKETGSEVINLRTKVEVEMTDKAPYHKAGTVTKVHPKLAEYFIKHKVAKAV